MNILLVLNNLYPTGGDWAYVKQVYDLFVRHGHKVYYFGLKQKEAVVSENQEYFVEYYDLGKAKQNLLNAPKVISKALYSKEAVRKIQQYIRDFSIDIVQINSMHLGVTPSIIRAVHSMRVPIVYRILDYTQVCPNIHMIRDGKVCKDCLKGRFYKCFLNNCKKSRFTSLFVALEAYLYTIRGDYNLVDMYSFQNDFMRNLFIDNGYNENHTVTINNLYDSSSTIPNYTLGNYVLFIGRLEPEKGVLTFLNAAKINNSIKHVVVGVGSLTEKVKEIISKMPNVDYLGSVWGEKLDSIIKSCRFVVCPSEWEEPSSYVAFQAFACGKPVIASRKGGLPEVVAENENGLFFNAGDVKDLSDRIEYLFYNKELIEALGRGARKSVEQKFSPEGYYRETVALFESLMKNDLT